MENVEEKVCIRCNKSKPLSYFNKYQHDAVRNICKKCQRAKGKVWEKKNKDRNLREDISIFLKTCSACGETKPSTEYYRDTAKKDGICSTCVPCAQQRALKHYQENREHKLELGYRQYVKRTYGLSPDDVAALIKKQNGKCAICGTEDSGSARAKRFVIDHCHKTGKNRAMLCFTCNSALGLAKDSSELLRKMADYLDKHNYQGPKGQAGPTAVPIGVPQAFDPGPSTPEVGQKL